MKISSFPRLNITDFPDLPQGMDDFVEALNQMFDETFTALTGRLTLPDNFNAEYRQVYLSQDVAQTLQTKIKGRPVEVSVVSANLYDYFPALAWKNAGENLIEVKAKWATAPSGRVLVTLKIVGE